MLLLGRSGGNALHLLIGTTAISSFVQTRRHEEGTKHASSANSDEKDSPVKEHAAGRMLVVHSCDLVFAGAANHHVGFLHDVCEVEFGSQKVLRLKDTRSTKKVNEPDIFNLELANNPFMVFRPRSHSRMAFKEPRSYRLEFFRGGIQFNHFARDSQSGAHGVFRVSALGRNGTFLEIGRVAGKREGGFTHGERDGLAFAKVNEGLVHVTSVKVRDSRGFVTGSIDKGIDIAKRGTVFETSATSTKDTPIQGMDHPTSRDLLVHVLWAVQEWTGTFLGSRARSEKQG